MLKRVGFCTLVIAAIASLHASEDWCFFAFIPVDVHPLIAKYLDFDYCETEAEFVARTEKLELERVTRLSYVPHEVYSPYQGNYEFETGCSGMYAAYCPNKTKFALFEGVYGGPNARKPKITIVHIEKKKVIHTENGLSTATREVAVSRKADMLAYLSKYSNNPILLRVKFITTETVKDSELPSCSCHEHGPIAFNKQGTQLIVHHIDQQRDDELSCAKGFTSYMDVDSGAKPCHFSGKSHTIYPLVSAEAIAEAEEKTLLGYFYHKRVCKSFGSAAQ